MERLIEETKLVLVECLVNAGVDKEGALHQIVTVNLLSRPPFRFIHSLVRTLALSERVMFAPNLFSGNELDVKSKKSRSEKVSNYSSSSDTNHEYIMPSFNCRRP
jgi:hypothetical protein